MRPAALVRTLSIAFAVNLAIVTGGCGGDRAATALVEAGEAYGDAQYGRAVECARRAAQTSQGVARDRANYLEGLGEWKLGRRDEGASLLGTVAQSSDHALAADALVSLGSLEIERKEFASAGRAYARAAELLEGTERRRAYGVALRCYDRAGLTVEADKLRTRAGLPPTDREIAAATGTSHSAASRTAPKALTDAESARPLDTSRSDPVTDTTDTTPLAPAATQLPPTTVEVAARNGSSTEQSKKTFTPAARYAIQAGAFSDAARARAVSLEVARRAQSGGTSGATLGAPRVVEKSSAGKTVYVVQIGNFANRTDAAAAMRRFDKLGYTVEPLAE